jgi:hypothetical protein
VTLDLHPADGGRYAAELHPDCRRDVRPRPVRLPLAVQVESARPHDVSSGRRLLDATLSDLGSVKAIVADRGYRGLAKMGAKRQINLAIKAPWASTRPSSAATWASMPAPT